MFLQAALCALRALRLHFACFARDGYVARERGLCRKRARARCSVGLFFTHGEHGDTEDTEKNKN